VDAPRFDEIAGDAAARLHDAVLVGHQLCFDRGFLASEFSRSNTALVAYLVAGEARDREPANQPWLQRAVHALTSHAVRSAVQVTRRGATMRARLSASRLSTT
jgi:DNA polymerase III epsilon subunit-like protein